jgi:hypothetical protein
MLKSLNEELSLLLSTFDDARSFAEHCRERGTPLTDNYLASYAEGVLANLLQESETAARMVEEFMHASRQYRLDGRRLHDYDVVIMLAACNAIKVACALERELRSAENPVDAFLSLHYDRPGVTGSTNQRILLAQLIETSDCINYASIHREYNQDTDRYEYSIYLKGVIEKSIPPVFIDGVERFRSLYRI